mgnify:CR=1 FL=1
MKVTKRSFVLPLNWSEHFSTWIIRDGDNHWIGYVNSEQDATLIVKAVNLFGEMVGALKETIENCGTCRHEPFRGRCARCITFIALLKKVKGE